MEIERHISETAFLANESKARCVEISRDIYSNLWISPDTKALWDEFASASCKYDDIELSLRNRYFLEHLESFLKSTKSSGSNEEPIFVNIASGFSSYPLLVADKCQFVEVDYSHVIKYKTEKLTNWEKQGAIPKREITYFTTDLCDHLQLDQLEANLKELISSRPSFVLMEGISYYLPLEILERIFSFLANTQQPGSILAVEYWLEDLQTYPAFQKLEQYFLSRFQYSPGTYTFIEQSFFENLLGYSVKEFSSTTEEEPKYSSSPKLGDFESVLPGQFCILVRNN